MAYAFNDDKTKMDIVCIHRTITNIPLTSKGIGSDEISAATLANTYGIDDISKYVRIGMKCYPTSQAYSGNWMDGYTVANETYPRATYNPVDGSMTVLAGNYWNDSTGKCEYKLILMRVES